MTPDQIIEAIRQLNDWDLKAVIEEARREDASREMGRANLKERLAEWAEHRQTHWQRPPIQGL